MVSLSGAENALASMTLQGNQTLDDILLIKSLKNAIVPLHKACGKTFLS